LPQPAFRYLLAEDLRASVGGRDATAVGPVTFTDGLTLPGATSSSTGYVRLPDDLVAQTGDDLTVSVWVKSDSPARNGA
ncbi:hypothetical protein, partial [Stenotrophomonas maltophilia]|uniref:hypothetical protein n=1 Tax=Stenotrophomonas maltophilia TaxID=40324 RepID=UPI0013D903B2